MADLLTHMLVAFSLATVAGWRLEWLDRPWAVVAAGGAAIPDLVKLELVLDSSTVGDAVGLSLTYAPFSTLGGVLLVAGVITLAFDRRQWPRVYGLLFAGGLSALALDGMRVFADGRASAWLYPFTNWRPPTPSLYVSADPRILVIALLGTAVVLLVDRRLTAG
ncbi:hypothetical protein [Haloarcula marina]|uniref:hypothetical protein n=1 Tax=Haloarcula marina TaxID=2961574 RepID=UPI0020B79CAE|nr:hypothetical protein [Halomicroarcula marina]